MNRTTPLRRTGPIKKRVEALEEALQQIVYVLNVDSAEPLPRRWLEASAIASAALNPQEAPPEAEKP